MNHDRRTADLIDRFFDSLAEDPAAAAPPDLDDETAAVIRAVVAESPVAPAAVRERVWQRALAGAARPLPVHDRRRWALFGGLVAAALAIAVTAVGVLPSGEPSSRTANLPTAAPTAPAADEIMARAQAALVSPAASGLQRLSLAEAVTIDEPGGSRVVRRTTRAYDLPDRWLVESDTRSTDPAGNSAERRALAVSDGAGVLTYATGDVSAVITVLGFWDARMVLGTFGAVPGPPRTNPPTDLTVVLQQAGTCFMPTLVGSDEVAGRAVWVVDLGLSRCSQSASPALGGVWTLWIDQQWSLVLRATQEVGGTARVRAEVEQIEAGGSINSARFRLDPPGNVPVVDYRPRPVRPERTAERE